MVVYHHFNFITIYCYCLSIYNSIFRQQVRFQHFLYRMCFVHIIVKRPSLEWYVERDTRRVFQRVRNHRWFSNYRCVSSGTRRRRGGTAAERQRDENAERGDAFAKQKPRKATRWSVCKSPFAADYMYIYFAFVALSSIYPLARAFLYPHFRILMYMCLTQRAGRSSLIVHRYMCV